jgi:hypothetical protein
VAEADVTLHPRGRLAVKVLVFDKPRSLCRFWRDALGNPTSRDTRGIVNGLGVQVEDYRGGELRRVFMRGDPRFFAVMGLCLGWLSMEVVSHEAVHAAYAYEERVGRNMFGAAAADFDEERIAYPAGRIAAGVNAFLHRKGLYTEARRKGRRQ